MSIYGVDSKQKKRREAWLGFLILAPFAVAFFGMALALGIEPRMFLERTDRETFRVTGSNQIIGWRFYSKTIEGVKGARHADGSRNRREDSIKERKLQSRRKRLVFDAADGAELSWSRTSDSRVIDDFIRSEAPTLALADPPPWWRAALAWGSAAFGVLILIGAIQNALFPKKRGLPD